MGKRQESAKQTRAAIVKASEELISEKGLDSVSIADIAERAGVSVGSFYTYFKKKEDVVQEIAYGRFDGIMESSSSKDGIADALTEFLTGSMRYIVDCGLPMCCSWIITSVSSGPIPGIPGGTKMDRDADFIRSLFKERGIETDDAVPMAISRAYYGMVFCWALSGGRTDPASEMEAFCNGPLKSILSGAGISARSPRRDPFILPCTFDSHGRLQAQAVRERCPSCADEDGDGARHLYAGGPPRAHTQGHGLVRLPSARVRGRLPYHRP